MADRTLEEERNGALITWYRATARPLPWRSMRDPYAILVSEVMLQQTQADRVVPYFERFIHEFPSAQSLADAPLHRVLELWSGLGYNSRAKRLRDAAAVVAADGWPRDVEGLMRHTHTHTHEQTHKHTHTKTHTHMHTDKHTGPIRISPDSHLMPHTNILDQEKKSQ